MIGCMAWRWVGAIGLVWSGLVAGAHYDRIRALFPVESSVSTHPGPVSMLFGEADWSKGDYRPVEQLWGNQTGRVCLSAAVEGSDSPPWCISSQSTTLQAELPLDRSYRVVATGELPITPAAIAETRRAEESKAAFSKRSSDINVAMNSLPGSVGPHFRTLWQQQLTVRRESRSRCVFGQEPCMLSATERPHCANLRTFRFLVYPEEQAERIAASAIGDVVNTTHKLAPLGALMRLLLAHPLRTRDPSQACVRIPAVNTACASGMCESNVVTSARLAALPLWQSGKDHLLWDYSDHWPYFDSGRALLAKSSYGEPWDVAGALREGGMYGLRPETDPISVPNLQPLVQGFDVAVPLTFYRCQMPLFGHLARASLGRRHEMGWSGRRVLASFMGVAYDLRRHGSVARASLAVAVSELERQGHLPSSDRWYARDTPRSAAPHGREASAEVKPLPVVIRLACQARVLNCLGERRTIHMSVRPQCKEWQSLSDADADHTASTGAPPPGSVAGSGPGAFDSLLASSRFGFVVPGEGTHSYRLLEVMSAGVVPVLLPGAAVPFHDLIDWAAVAVTHSGPMDTPGVRTLLDRLAAMTQEDWLERRAAGARVFEGLLSSPRRHVDAVFVTLARRFRQALRAQQGGAPGGEAASAAAMAEQHLLERRGWAQSSPHQPWREAAPVGPEGWFSDAVDHPFRQAAPWHATQPLHAAEPAQAVPGSAGGVPSAVPELAWAASPAAAIAALRSIAEEAAHPGTAVEASGSLVAAQPGWLASPRILRGGAFVRLPGTGRAGEATSLASPPGALLVPAPMGVLADPAALLGAHAHTVCSGAHADLVARALEAVRRLEPAAQDPAAGGGALPGSLAGAESAFASALASLRLVEHCVPTPALRTTRGASVGALLATVADAFARCGALRQAVTAGQAAIVLVCGSPQFRLGTLPAEVLTTVLAVLKEVTTRYQDAVRQALAAAALHGSLTGAGFRLRNITSSPAHEYALGLPAGAAEALWNGLRMSSVGDLAPVLPEPGTLSSARFEAEAAVPGAEQQQSGFALAMRGLRDGTATEEGADASQAWWSDAAAPWVEWSAARFARRLRQDEEAAEATLRRAELVARLVVGRDWLPGQGEGAPSEEADRHWKTPEALPAAAALAAGREDGAGGRNSEQDWNGARVAVVSLCAYDAAKTSITAVSMTNKLAYCSRHGYDCLLETQRLDMGRPAAWGKVRYMLEHSARAQWAAWVDCDSLFTNFSLPLEGILARAGAISRDPASTPPELRGVSPAPVAVLSEDGASLNTGVFFIRNCPLGRQLLEAVWGGDASAASPFETHPWWEQAAFIDAVTFGPLAQALAGKIVTVPQAAINGYPPDIAAKFAGSGRPLHAVWQPGDSIVSFSGCARMLQDSDMCEGYLEQFETVALQERWRDERLVRQRFGLRPLGASMPV